MNIWTKNWTTPLRVLLAGAGISAAALLTPFVVSAVTPPAGSNITNQAGATYFDTSGKKQTVSSNEVSTLVTQVYSLTLTSDATKTGAGGNTLNFSHVLTNTGNGNDLFTIVVTDPSTNTNNFTNIAIYADPTGGGVPPSGATPLGTCTTAAPFVCTVLDVNVAGNNGNFKFVVSYTLPGTVPTGLFEQPTVTATSQGQSSKTASNIDTVNGTTGAAFSSGKSIAKPGVAAPSTLTGSLWPAAPTSGKASLSTCTADIAGVNGSPANGCTYTVYTIDYKNNGSAPGAYYMSDTLPAGMTYVPGTAVWSGAGGVALNDSSSTLTATGNPVGIQTAYISGTKTLKFDVASVINNGSGSISFVVMINSTARPGITAPDTTNTANYSTTTCDAICAGGTPTTTTTGGSPFPVTSVYAVIAANSATGSTFDSGVPPAAGENVVVVSSANLGSTVTFHNFVINKGNTADTFNVAIDPISLPLAGGVHFPAGTTFAFFQKDGVTPLGDTNNDTIPDTNLLQKDGVAEIVVVATLPGNAVLPTTKVDVLMTATSVGDSTKKDSVWDEVTTITTSAVDLTNTPNGNQVINGTVTSACTPGSNCDVGQGPSTNPTDTQSVNPGQTAKFPLYINNSDPTGNPTFNITSSLPPGWGVKIVSGSDCSVAAATNPVSISAPVLGVPPLYTACVTPPVGTPSGDNPITFTVTSTSHPDVNDTIKDQVTVTKPNVPDLKLTPETGTNSTPPGGSSSTPVTLSNPGTTQCGAGTGATAGFNVSVTGVPTGWSALVYIDMNGDGAVSPTDKYIDTTVSATTANLIASMLTGITPAGPAIPLLPGTSLPLLVKLIASDAATSGTKVTATLTVTDLNTDTAAKCPTKSGQYSALVVNGQLRVVKSQAVQAAVSDACPTTTPATLTELPLSVDPGACIYYKVIATNEGAANVTGVTVNDFIKTYTTFADQPTGTNCSASGAKTSGGTTATPSISTPTTGTTGGTISCSLALTDVLAPNGTITLIYQVRVDKN